MAKPLVLSADGNKQEITANQPLEIGYAAIDASGLTAPQTYALPNKSGTFALTSDIPVVKAIGSTITVNNTVLSTTSINIIAPSAAITVLFPVSPAVGTKVDIRFINAATYNVTQNGNDSNLRGFNDVYIATGNYYMTWQYFGTVAGVNIGWDIVALGRQ